MKAKINSLMIEGIIFFGSGLGLLSYSLYFHEKAFVKEWSQSPYLFPLAVAAALILLSVNLIVSGGRAARETRAARAAADASGRREENARAAADASGRREENARAAADASGRKEENARGGPDASDCPARKMLGVAVVICLCIAYYAALALLQFPYVTIGILSFQYTFSTFEVATLVFLAAMMWYMGVRKPLLLTLVPLGTALFLSIAFRAMLHVLLP